MCYYLFLDLLNLRFIFAIELLMSSVRTDYSTFRINFFVIIESFSEMFLLNSLNSVTKALVITVKGFESATSCVRDRDTTTVPVRNP